MVKRVPYYKPGTEVSGEVLGGFAANLNADRFAPFLEEKGLKEVDPSQWYPIELLMDVFEKMEDDMMSFVAAGMSIAEHSIMPDNINNPTLEQMIEAWDEHYQVNHRNGAVSTTIPSKVADQHYTIQLQVNHTYPYDLVYGLAYGFCKQLLPAGTDFLVEYDEDQNPKAEDPECILVHIKWGAAAS